MLVIFQVHAELSARGSVIAIWIESAQWPSTFQGQDPALKSLAWTSKISESRGARTSRIIYGENETLKKNGVG